jgi:uncharacterized protein (TIGR03382 family)
MKNQKNLASASFVVALAAFAGSASAVELTTNGGFEAGDLSGWASFPTTNSTFNITTDSNSGVFGAEVFNNDPAAGAVVKQANLGKGLVKAGETITISFAVKGSTANGGVAFAEFFSEIDGGGVSKSQILGGGPLALTGSYQIFNFVTTAGDDVSGGVTLQFAAVTGADTGSVAVLFIDDASVTIIPAPGALAIFGLGGLAAIRRRR